MTKKFILAFASVCMLMSAVCVISSCSSSDNEDEPNNELTERFDSVGDTIYVDMEAPVISKISSSELPQQTQSLYNSFKPLSRTYDDVEIYHLYDELTDKSAYAMPHPSLANVWVYECYNGELDHSIILMFEQVSENEFVVRDENGNILRSFIYNPETMELWTYNSILSRRELSGEDKFMCGTAFVAACFVVGEALAVPTGGASFALSLGFFALSSYICD